MRSLFLSLVTLLSSSLIIAQNNFGFEKFKPGTDTLQAWGIVNGQKFRSGTFLVDGDIKHSGNYSLCIDRNHVDSTYKFTVASIKIPVDFDGNKASASCWLKTQDVSDHAVMWIRIDDAHGKVLNNINYPWDNRLIGTNAWKKYSTTFDLPETASTIYLGFLLSDEGKAWADDFSLSVDGSPLEKIAGKGRTIKNAATDSADFSKGSKILIGNLTASQTENLSQLAKVWGFLKYYHPSIAEGNYNWDFELFRFLPSYLNTNDVKQRDDRLVQWINSFGAVPVCKKCKEELKNTVIKPDLDWINDLSDSLKDALNFIKENRHQGKKYYMELYPGVGNPNILHENPYSQFVYPDEGYRLLALFRYWNIIQYWFPDKHLIGEDWKNVLNEFIPKFINAKNEMEYWTAAEQLIARIHDSHAYLAMPKTQWTNRHGRLFPPVMLTFVANDPVVSVIVKDTLSALSNIKRGDVIKSVNGRKIDDIIKERLSNLPASNYPSQLRDLSLQLLRSHDSISNIGIERDGKQMEIKLHHLRYDSWYRYDFPYQADSSFFFIRPGIGYINLGKIKKGDIDRVFKSLEGSKGLIIDDRQYPGDFVIYDIAAKLNPQPTPFSKTTMPSLDYPGAIRAGRILSAGRKNNNYYKGKLIIIVNEKTQSSGEFHAIAFRTAPNSKIIGSTTAGADGNITNAIYLPGGIYTRFSGIGIQYPDGTETQRVGIIPDIEVKRTIKGIAEGRDELVDKAIELINQD